MSRNWVKLSRGWIKFVLLITILSSYLFLWTIYYWVLIWTMLKPDFADQETECKDWRMKAKTANPPMNKLMATEHEDEHAAHLKRKGVIVFYILIINTIKWFVLWNPECLFYRKKHLFFGNNQSVWGCREKMCLQWMFSNIMSESYSWRSDDVLGEKKVTCHWSRHYLFQILYFESRERNKCHLPEREEDVVKKACVTQSSAPKITAPKGSLGDNSFPQTQRQCLNGSLASKVNAQHPLGMSAAEIHQYVSSTIHEWP